MTENTTIREGDVGTHLMILPMKQYQAIDVSGADTYTIRLRKPNSQIVDVIAFLTVDGGLGYLHYKTQVGDIDMTGTWYMSGIVDWANGDHISTSPHSFRVYPAL